MKKIKYKKQFMAFLGIIVLCIISIIIFKPYYKAENREDNIRKIIKDKKKPNPLGWIRVQGTNIDYPVMYYNDVEDISDPTYDLAWSFENNKKLINRTVILSHNMRNVSNKPLIGNKEHARFEQLMGFIYYDFVKDNKYIQYTINNKNHLFKIYGVSLQKEETLELENISKSDVNNYIKDTKRKSYFDFDVEVKKSDNLITLVTCTRFFGNADYSFVVDAREVRDNERISNYRVKEKSNYKSIKKIMKGDDKNE